MADRRQFLTSASGMLAGLLVSGWGGARAALQNPATVRRRTVTVGGRRIRTVDVHTHVVVPEASALLKGTPLDGRGSAGAGPGSRQVMGAERLPVMDAYGIDVQVLSINPFWYGADRALSTRLIELQNDALAGMCAAQPDRFVRSPPWRCSIRISQLAS